MDWFASYHYIFVHFPIALIIMAGIAELIMAIRRSIALDNTVMFLLVSAMIFIIPTIATGLILEETGIVSESNHLYLEWHESFAFITLSLALATLLLRFWLGRHILYFASLILLVLSVIITAHFGGTMAFGPIDYFPSLSSL